jgi:hypothetical protein
MPWLPLGRNFAALLAVVLGLRLGPLQEHAELGFSRDSVTGLEVRVYFLELAVHGASALVSARLAAVDARAGTLAGPQRTGSLA